MMLLSRGCVLLARAIYRPKALHARELTQVGRILLIQPYDTLGDVIFTSPLPRELKRAFPDAEIMVVTSAHGVPGVLDENPHISSIIPVNVRCNRLLRPLLLPWRHWRLARRVLRRQRFDVAIVPRYTVDAYFATFLAYFSGAPCRIGYTENTVARKSVLNRGYDRLLTDVLPASHAIENEVVRNLHVLSVFGKRAEDSRTEIWIDDADRQFAAEALQGLTRRRACIAPTSGHSWLKQWGADRFAELAVELNRQGCDIVLVGAAQDKSLADGIAQRLNGVCLNLVGETSVREMAAVMAECAVYIGNDAGPGHVASAMGVPTVSIFGSSCHHQFAPWGERNRVLTVEMECGPCRMGHLRDRCDRCIYSSPRCLEAITVAEALAAAVSLLPPPEFAAKP